MEEKLSKAVQLFEKDSQMRHAILGFEVMDAATGKLIYERNGQTGLAPASTQKIITSAAAFELLGHDYRFTTELFCDGNIRNGVLDGRLFITGVGDPTLGSWRYSSTKDSNILKQWVNALSKKGIKRITGDIIPVNIASYSYQAIPDGWIWQDIGNYYGAGSYSINWKENQFDVVLKSGDNVGDKVEVISVGSVLLKDNYKNELKTAAKGTGDNAYIYFPTSPGRQALLAGTIPAGEKSFSISGAFADPGYELKKDLAKALSAASIKWGNEKGVVLQSPMRMPEEGTHVHLHRYQSPPLDSINYWFMRRSINLYGEALIKRIGYEGRGVLSTDTGVRAVRDFWAANGIDKAAINIIDGSGLSPQNRITADALVQVLRFAKTRPWYASFYESLPAFNGMKLKSGSIGGARAFAGYHTSAQGKEYIMAIIVNNYAGSSGEIVKKMYAVLNELK